MNKQLQRGGFSKELIISICFVLFVGWIAVEGLRGKFMQAPQEMRQAPPSQAAPQTTQRLGGDATSGHFAAGLGFGLVLSGSLMLLVAGSPNELIRRLRLLSSGCTMAGGVTTIATGFQLPSANYPYWWLVAFGGIGIVIIGFVGAIKAYNTHGSSGIPDETIRGNRA